MGRFLTPGSRLFRSLFRRTALHAVLSGFLLFGAVGALTATGASAANQTYVVQRGDTLNRIAGWYGVSVWSIVNVNGIANPDLIYPGQVLVIPTGGSAPATTTRTVSTAPATTAATSSNVRWIRWKVTMYCLTGRMANGEYVHHGAAAADRSILPLGAQVYLEGFGTLTIKDRFAWDGGEYRIDIWEPSCARALQWGIRYVDGYIVSR